MGLFGEEDGDSGWPLMSTGNDIQVEKGMVSISQENATNAMIVSKEQQGVTDAPRWEDLVDE